MKNKRSERHTHTEGSLFRLQSYQTDLCNTLCHQSHTTPHHTTHTVIFKKKESQKHGSKDPRWIQLHICQCVYLCACLSVCLSVCLLCIYLCASLSVCLSVCVSVCLYVCVCVSVTFCVSISVSTFLQLPYASVDIGCIFKIILGPPYLILHRVIFFVCVH